MIVEYRLGGWNRVHLPERGSHSAWADGLLNILDANGRCVEAKQDVQTVWYDEEAFFKAHPECRDESSMTAMELIAHEAEHEARR